MNGLFDFHDPHMKALLMVQVIGFPIAFLARCLLYNFKAIKGSPADKDVNLLRALANLFFALTSISFVFNQWLGGICLTVGVILSTQSFRLVRRSQREWPPAVESLSPQNHKAGSHTGSRKRRKFQTAS